MQLKPAAVSAKLTSDQPRILYQCGDCDELFKSLDLWQQHRKEETCQQSASASKSKPDSQPEPETASAQISNSTLNPDDFSLENCETSNLKLETLEKPNAEEETQQVADTSSAQSSDPPVSEVATSTSNPEDSSPKKRGANKKPKPEPVLLCVDCGSCFGLVSELVSHRKTQHGFEEALHRCSVCGESFLNTTLFLYHRKQHRQKGEEKVVAVPEETSEEVFTQSNGTDEQGHDATPSTISVTSSFSQPKLFLCTQCGQSFSDEGGLVTHRKQKHDLKEPLHSCPHCGESFMNTTQYLYHRRQHRFTSGTEVTDGAEASEETATTKLDDTQQSSKRLLSPPASASESGSPLPKRSRPSFRVLSGVHALKGQQNICLKDHLGGKIRHLLHVLVLNEIFFYVCQETKVQPPKKMRRAALQQTQTTPITLHLPSCCRTGPVHHYPMFAPTVAKPSPDVSSSALMCTATPEKSFSHARCQSVFNQNFLSLKGNFL